MTGVGFWLGWAAGAALAFAITALIPVSFLPGFLLGSGLSLLGALIGKAAWR